MIAPRNIRLLIPSLFACLIFVPEIHTKAQSGRYRSLAAMDSIRAVSGVIYGSFVQRLGFSSGGFAQEIQVVELTTGKAHRFPVKPTFKSAKENFFSHRLPPGTYAIETYNWTRSTWYGGKVFTEPVFKNGSNADIEAKIHSGELKPEELRRFTFNVQPGTLTYVGTWHFEKEPVSFSEDKDVLDKERARELQRFKMKTSAVAIPE